LALTQIFEPRSNPKKTIIINQFNLNEGDLIFSEILN